jgi:AbrB family looped-hinge helix DNA binding protein
MTLVKVRRSAWITLPAALRRIFGLQEGDVLEAEAVEGGILLKPDAAHGRADTRRRLLGAAAGLRDLAPTPDLSAPEEKEEIAEAVKAFRRASARCSGAMRGIS